MKDDAVFLKHVLDSINFVGMELELNEILGKKVDLVPKNALKPRIGKHILEEVKYI